MKKAINRTAPPKNPCKPRCKCTKQMAMSDIDKECGQGRFFSKNYVRLEKTILSLNDPET